MTDAVVFIWQHGLANHMERDASGGSFVRESSRSLDPANDNPENDLGPWGGAGE